MNNVIDGVSGKSCGGIGSILAKTFVGEEEEEDYLEVGKEDVQNVVTR